MAQFKAHSGTEAPCHLSLHLSCTTPCSRHPTLPRIFSYRVSFSTQPCLWLFIHLLAFHSLTLFVFLLCVYFLQTVHHRLPFCAFAFLLLFLHKLIFCNNIVIPSKPIDLHDCCLLMGFFINLQGVQHLSLSAIVFQSRQCNLMAPSLHIFVSLGPQFCHPVTPNHSIAVTLIIVFLGGQSVKI